MNVATTVRRMRERAGHTQQELATAAECSLSTVIRIERGDTKPSLDLLESIAAACGRRVAIKFPLDDA